MPVRYGELSSGPSTRQQEPTNVYHWVVDYGSMTKAELQDLASEQGLSTAGTKADLIERLTA